MPNLLKKAIKHPHLIKSSIYSKHLGLLFCHDLAKYNPLTRQNCPFLLEKSDDKELISSFYNSVGRSSITTQKAEFWLNEGHECWIAKLNDEVVGALWVFFNYLEIGTLSSRVLSKNRTIHFDSNVGYEGYVIVSQAHRGKGVYGYLKEHILNHYKENGRISKLILTTGATNSPMICALSKYSARLVGIVQVRNIIGIVKRKELFIDKKNKVWH